MVSKSLPLHGVLHHVCFNYAAWIASMRLGVPRGVRWISMALLAMVLYIPYYTIGSKYLFFTVHDTEPTYAVRFGTVPLILFVHALAFSLSILLVTPIATRYINMQWYIFNCID